MQDEWRVHPQLTFNLGFRYDTFNYDDDLGRSVFSSGLLQPRAGIAWDITGDAKNVVKAYGGRYSDTSLVSLPTVVNSRANATDVYANETMFGDLNGDGTIEERAFWYTFGGPGGSAFANGGKLDSTSVVEYQLSYERQLGASSAAGITAVRRKTYDIIEDTYDPNTGVYIIDNLPGLDRNYYGVELRYRTQWKKLYLESSYTWAKSRGNIEYTQSLGSDFDFPALSWNRYGYLSDDTRHALRFNGYYRLPLDFQISYAWNWISGYPWTPFRPAQPEAPYGNIFLEARGSERLPRYHQLDLDFRKTFKLGGDMSLEAVFTLLNVFDTEIVTSVNGQVPQAGQALTWQTPRRFEFGARFAF